MPQLPCSRLRAPLRHELKAHANADAPSFKFQRTVDFMAVRLGVENLSVKQLLAAHMAAETNDISLVPLDEMQSPEDLDVRSEYQFSVIRHDLLRQVAVLEWLVEQRTRSVRIPTTLLHTGLLDPYGLKGTPLTAQAEKWLSDTQALRKKLEDEAKENEKAYAAFEVEQVWRDVRIIATIKHVDGRGVRHDVPFIEIGYSSGSYFIRETKASKGTNWVLPEYSTTECGFARTVHAYMADKCQDPKLRVQFKEVAESIIRKPGIPYKDKLLFRRLNQLQMMRD